MRHRLLTLMALVAGLALFTTSCGGGGGSTSTVELAADGSFTAETVDGEAIASTDYAGQDVMLWFWAPW